MAAGVVNELDDLALVVADPFVVLHDVVLYQLFLLGEVLLNQSHVVLVDLLLVLVQLDCVQLLDLVELLKLESEPALVLGVDTEEVQRFKLHLNLLLLLPLRPLLKNAELVEEFQSLFLVVLNEGYEVLVVAGCFLVVGLMAEDAALVLFLLHEELVVVELVVKVFGALLLEDLVQQKLYGSLGEDLVERSLQLKDPLCIFVGLLAEALRQVLVELCDVDPFHLQDVGEILKVLVQVFLVAEVLFLR